MPTGPVFTPEQIYVMHKAFEAVCAKLRLRSGGRAREEVAVTIVDFAAAGVLNLDTLTTATLAAARQREEPKPSAPKRGARAA
jgi:hypothetical protein